MSTPQSGQVTLIWYSSWHERAVLSDLPSFRIHNMTLGGESSKDESRGRPMVMIYEDISSFEDVSRPRFCEKQDPIDKREEHGV